MEVCTVVLDVGKTHTKLSVWDGDGERLEQTVRVNQTVVGRFGRELDTGGIEVWLVEALSDVGRRWPVRRIIPTAHGAAAALIADDRLVAPVADYEEATPPALSETYDGLRDSFAQTGSPSLPGGLNMGRQLFALAARDPQAMERLGLKIVTWPEYWSWFLCGEIACERSSLGCHTDLWAPGAERYSPLAGRLGLADRFAPLREAGEALGALRPELARRTGLSAQVTVHCGVHDSNAGLMAARGHGEIRGKAATVLSTGTWFVAMNPGGDLRRLDPRRDCLVNVSPAGRPTPSARFMGGRETQLLSEEGAPQLQVRSSRACADILAQLLDDEPAIVPGLIPGAGPYGDHHGGWVHRRQQDRDGAIALYLAAVASEMLHLVSASDTLIVEGRFAKASVFVTALATLNPKLDVMVCERGGDAAFGALRCLDPDLSLEGVLRRAEPAPLDPSAYLSRWRARLEQNQVPA